MKYKKRRMKVLKEMTSVINETSNETAIIKMVDFEKIRDTFTPSPIQWEKENGVIFTLYHGDCYVCDSQKTVYWLKEIDEAFCIVCWSRTDLNTAFMKNLYRQQQELKKEILEDFDKFDYEVMQERIQNHYSEYQEIKGLIYSPQYADLVPQMRQTKIYKTHSKTISDEDKLFLVVYLYRDRNKHRIDDMTEAEVFNDFKKWLVENKDVAYLSRAERRRLARKGMKE